MIQELVFAGLCRAPLIDLQTICHRAAWILGGRSCNSPEAQYVYYIQLDTEAGLLHTAEQEDRFSPSLESRLCRRNNLQAVVFWKLKTVVDIFGTSYLHLNLRKALPLH